jgi:hypothetical protein
MDSKTGCPNQRILGTGENRETPDMDGKNKTVERKTRNYPGTRTTHHKIKRTTFSL